jgi:hypothetical protein
MLSNLQLIKASGLSVGNRKINCWHHRWHQPHRRARQRREELEEDRNSWLHNAWGSPDLLTVIGGPKHLAGDDDVGATVEIGNRLIAVKAALPEPCRDHAQEWMPFVL